MRNLEQRLTHLMIGFIKDDRKFKKLCVKQYEIANSKFCKELTVLREILEENKGDKKIVFDIELYDLLELEQTICEHFYTLADTLGKELANLKEYKNYLSLILSS